MAAYKTNKTVTTTFNLPLSTSVHDIKGMRIWKKKDGAMTTLPVETFTLSYMGKEVSDETMLAEIAIPGEPVTFAIQNITITVVGNLDSVEYEWVLRNCPFDHIAAFKGNVYGCSEISPACQQYRYDGKRHMGFNSTTFISNNEESARTLLKDSAVLPGNKLRLTEKFGP